MVHHAPAVRFGLLLLATATLGVAATGAAIPLQSATATFSQSGPGGDFPASETIDGIFIHGENGWAIFNFGTMETLPQTIVWETAADVTAPAIEVRLHQVHGNRHLIGCFRVSVTADDRAKFADGLANGGDVSAAWTVVTPTQIDVPAGLSVTPLGGGTVLMGGKPPESGVYTLRLDLPFTGMTGLRLETFEHHSLPFEGPGMQPVNGNFVLSEIEVFMVKAGCPEDLNGDGLVGFADLNIVLDDFNTSGEGLPGDVDQDGDVDFEDLNRVVSLFNTEC